jgi:Arc/MetJ-type ribon-helix-helix transcriptional regulator
MHSGMVSGVSQQIAVRLDDDDLAALDQAIARGRYPSRAAAIRAGVEFVLREERDREIADAYRLGYGEHPQDEAEGAAGLALMAEHILREERGHS